MAGADPRVDFSDRAADRIYQVSGGVPTLVNLICDRALTLGFAALASVVDVDIVDAAVDDLELTPPEPVSRWLLRDAAIIIAFALLVLAGAVAAARVLPRAAGAPHRPMGTTAAVIYLLASAS